jgi:glycosyltransferase involved in cell wall biosynthesis
MLSFYYPPDLSAGSFRSSALSEALVRLMDVNDRLDVLTTMPNRYASFRMEALENESLGIVNIRRFRTPQHSGGMWSQAKIFISFARNVKHWVSKRNYDIVIATSSRLATAALGAQVAHSIKAPLYLDIRDIFTDTMGDLLAGKPMAAILPLLKMVEHSTFKRASCINLVSEGFKGHMQKIVPEKDLTFYSNGIDEKFIGKKYIKSEKKDRLIILYAGNIGTGQGLDCILPKVALMLGNDYKIMVVGDGSARQKLQNEVARLGVQNLEIHDPVTRDELMQYYSNADYLLLHLNDYPAFHKVLPSKIFEYGATGKPIIAGVAGFARDFIQRELDCSEVFNPCNAECMVKAIMSITNAECDRSNFINKFNRGNIMNTMAKDIFACSQNDSKK